MTWKFIYTYREWCKRGSAHNRCWNWSPFTSKHTWKRFSKFWNTFPKVSTLTAWTSWRIASLSCSIVRGVFLYTLPFSGPQRRSRQALDRLPLVSKFLTNFWMQHFDGARLSQNSVRNAVWHVINEPVCQYLRKRNRRCSTVYIDNSLGPLARESPCSYYYCYRHTWYGWGGWCVWHVWGIGGMFTGSWWGNLKARYYLGKLSWIEIQC